MAVLSFTTTYNAHVDDRVNPGYELQAAYTFEQAYVWGSVAKNTQTLQTQRMGTVMTYSLGAGWKFQSGFFVEGGLGFQKHDENERVWREAIYYVFEPTFGTPPFAEGWNQVEYIYDVKDSFSIRVGYEWDWTQSLSSQISYKYHQPREYFRIWNPGFIVDNAEGGKAYPYWEGESKIDNSAVQFSIKYSF